MSHDQLNRYKVVVTWTQSESYTVEAEDESSASDIAIERAYGDHPYADDYDTAWEPELLPAEPAA